MHSETASVMAELPEPECNGAIASGELDVDGMQVCFPDRLTCSRNCFFIGVIAPSHATPCFKLSMRLGVQAVGEYGWLVVKSVACPHNDAAETTAAPAAVQQQVLSLCSCPSGKYPTRSCDLSRGEIVQCAACSGAGCPAVLPPPVLSGTAVVLPAGKEEAELQLFGSPDAKLRYIINQ